MSAQTLPWAARAGGSSLCRRPCYSEPMKFVSPSHFADPDAAARKLVQIANASEAVQDGRIYVGNRGSRP
jgi:hypothetical protein